MQDKTYRKKNESSKDDQRIIVVIESHGCTHRMDPRDNVCKQVCKYKGYQSRLYRVLRSISTFSSAYIYSCMQVCAVEHPHHYWAADLRSHTMRCLSMLRSPMGSQLASCSKQNKARLCIRISDMFIEFVISNKHKNTCRKSNYYVAYAMNNIGGCIHM